jgi:hypothetical protein
MTALDLTRLTGVGCTLDEGGWARQRERMRRLRSHVERVEERDGVLHVAFDGDTDRALIDDFVATEGECCSFLSLGYDERERVLRIRSGDAQGLDVVRGFAAVFSGGGA